jgi:hypothetical protein
MLVVDTKEALPFLPAQSLFLCFTSEPGISCWRLCALYNKNQVLEIF